MSEPVYTWKSIACEHNFDSYFPLDAPAPDFDPNDMISDMERKYRVHTEYTVLVDVTKLTGWRYMRRPHKAVVAKLISIFKVRNDSQVTYLIHSPRVSVTSHRFWFFMRTIHVILVKYWC